MRIGTRDPLVVAVRTAAVTLASFVAGRAFTALFHAGTAMLGGIWSAVSGIVVMQATIEDTRGSALLRVVGTLIGAVVAAIYLSFLPFTPLGMGLCVGVTVLVCQAVRVPDHARLASVTVVIVMAVSVADPALRPVVNAALRFCESVIGAAIGTLAVLLTTPRRREE